MKIVDCYLRALQKAEENMTNGGIKLDKARFVQLFNDEQNRLVRYILDKKNEEDIRYIQKLVVYSKELDEKGDKDNPESTLFSLPSDFFSFSNISGVFEEQLNQCKRRSGKLWTAKQIEENLSSGVFSEYFEKEFAYLQNTILFAESFCCGN